MYTIKIPGITAYEQLQAAGRGKEIFASINKKLTLRQSQELELLRKSQYSEPTVITTREKYKLIVSTDNFFHLFSSLHKITTLMKLKERKMT